MIDLEIDIDAYGGEVRASALADALEIQAVGNEFSMTESQLTDYVQDNGWGRRYSDKFVDAGDENEDHGPTARDHAAHAFMALRQRADLLGSLYPFEVDNANGLLRRRHSEAKTYDVLIALTTAHAHRIDIGVDPRVYLEDLVVRSFKALGFMATGLGTSNRQKVPSFEDRFLAACADVEMRGDPTAAVRRREANDEGVDVLARFPISPLRYSAWTALCQVTCGRSETWKGKIHEAAPRKWRRFLNTDVEPTAFLAVPHHVIDLHLKAIEQDSGGMVLDRLHLVSAIRDDIDDTDLDIAHRLRGIRIAAPYTKPRALGRS